MDSVSDGLSKKVALEFGMNHATISTGTSNISPDSSGFVQFATRSHCVVLCFVYMSTSLVRIEFSFISGINTFNFKKGSCALPLILEDSASSQQKNSLDYNLPDIFAVLEVLFPAYLYSLQRQQKEKDHLFLNSILAW